MRDLERMTAPDLQAVVEDILAIRPDVLLVLRFDHDAGGVAAGLLARRLAEGGLDLHHVFAPRPNSGMRTGIDLDGDGRTGGPADAQGWGYFSGQGGMALLSRLPIDHAATRDFTGFLWRDLPDALLPEQDGAPFPSAEAVAVQRLAYVGAWDVALALPGGGAFHVLATHAQPPIRARAERNLRRNADALRFWRLYLEGWAPGGAEPFAAARFALMGTLNVDAHGGDGDRGALRRLLEHPALADPRPSSAGAMAAAVEHGRDPALPGIAEATVDFTGGRSDLGLMRLDYILPAAGLVLRGAGVHWPKETPLRDAPRHRLVWVDVALD